MFEVKKILFLLVLTILVTAGCGGNMENELTDNDNTAGDLVNTGDELPGRTMSDQNPNLISTGSERNHGREIEHARQVVEDTGEFTPDSIWINGRDMWVTATKKGQLTSKEKTEAQAKLHKLLTKALPIYDIEVRVNEDR